MSEYRFRKPSNLGMRGRKPGDPNMYGNPAISLNEYEAAKRRSQNLGGTKTMSTSTALVRPGDIDAVDSRDLLTTLVSQNIAAVEDKNELRERKAWVEEQRTAINKIYEDKAKTAYEKIWSTCQHSKVGHDFHTRDVGGRNVRVCNVCSYHASAGGASYEVSLNEKYAKEMNTDLIKMMIDRMIELDVEAGILVFPEEDDMPTNKLSRKNKWFSNGKDPVGAGIKR